MSELKLTRQLVAKQLGLMRGSLDPCAHAVFIYGRVLLYAHALEDESRARPDRHAFHFLGRSAYIVALSPHAVESGASGDVARLCFLPRLLYQPCSVAYSVAY